MDTLLDQNNTSFSSNHAFSALNNPMAVDDKLDKEVQWGRIADPFYTWSSAKRKDIPRSCKTRAGYSAHQQSFGCLRTSNSVSPVIVATKQNSFSRPSEMNFARRRAQQFSLELQGCRKIFNWNTWTTWRFFADVTKISSCNLFYFVFVCLLHFW